ncbi:MAG TPA: hypothetical protein V6D19_08335 [Stenomitos sp.]
MSLKQRFLKGLGANAFGQIVTALIQIVSVPVFLKNWGVELYGEWIILSSIQSYFLMSDIGFSSVAANKMTMLVSNDKRNEALVTFQSVQMFVSIISIIIFLFAITICSVFPVEKSLNIHLLSHKDVYIIILIMTLEVLINLQIGFISAGFRCEGEYARGSFYFSLNRLLTFGSISISVIFGANPILASIISLVVSAICFTVMLKHLQRLYPWIQFGTQYVSLQEIKKLLIPASTFMAFPLGNALSIQGLITIIGVTLGSHSVVIFSTLRTLTRFTWQIMNTINNSIWPELSIAFGRGDLPLVRLLHRRACQASLILSLIFIVLLSIFGLKIISIWTLGTIKPDRILFALMLVVIFFDAFWLTSSILPVATNQHSKVSIYYLLGTSCSIVFSYIFLPKIGLYSAALSLLLIDFFMILVVIRTSMRISKDTYKDFVLSLIKVKSPLLLIK